MWIPLVSGVVITVNFYITGKIYILFILYIPLSFCHNIVKAKDCFTGGILHVTLVLEVTIHVYNNNI